MLERVRSYFNPEDRTRLPRRMFWIGFLVRVLYMGLAHTYRIRLAGDHFQFGWEMGRIARSLATGHGFANPFNGFSGPSAWTPPLYPLVLAGVFKLFGVYTLKSAAAILTCNSVFSAATAPVVYEIAWRCFGRTSSPNPAVKPGGLSIALWSGWLWALYPAAMQYAVKWVWDMSLTAFLFAWVLVLALRIRGIGSCELQVAGCQSKETTASSKHSATSQPATCNLQLTTSWLLFGLLWGLISLSNSSLLTFLPACGLWMIWPALRTRVHLGAALRQATLAGVCFIVTISPWVVRNWIAFHAFVPMRSNFGAEFYEATLASNDGMPWGTTLPLVETAPEFRRFVSLGEVAYSRQQGDLAKAAMRAHPGHFIRNAFLRVYLYWFGVPQAGPSAWLEAGRLLNFAFLSLAGLFGLALALRRHIPGAWLFFWAFTSFPLLYYFLTVQARFRHPLEPVICVLSVYLFQSADRSRTWSWQKASAKSQ
jgi:hypothetical protein